MMMSKKPTAGRPKACLMVAKEKGLLRAAEGSTPSVRVSRNQNVVRRMDVSEKNAAVKATS